MKRRGKFKADELSAHFRTLTVEVVALIAKILESRHHCACYLCIARYDLRNE